MKRRPDIYVGRIPEKKRFTHLLPAILGGALLGYVIGYWLAPVKYVVAWVR